jgi:hypothetical protein
LPPSPQPWAPLQREVPSPPPRLSRGLLTGSSCLPGPSQPQRHCLLQSRSNIPRTATPRRKRWLHRCPNVCPCGLENKPKDLKEKNRRGRKYAENTRQPLSSSANFPPLTVQVSRRV